jgi:dihydrodipicolinate synthase/N-acetylneuraminate lyase
VISASDLKGISAMMPAFATDQALKINATETIDLDRLANGVDRMVKAGVDVITTTGSFGEASNLLLSELSTLARGTVEVVNHRVPVIIGCVSQNSREIFQKMKIAQDAGADGVIVAVPSYFPSTVENAVNMFSELAEAYPKLGILIYHNPTLHRITLPVAAFEAISKNKNIVGMKDSHRSPLQFMQLMDIVRGKISVFVNQAQYYPYRDLGAAGFWSIDIWMGPEPLIYLKRMVEQGNIAKVREVLMDISSYYRTGDDLRWREMAHKIAVRYAGFVDPGPLRPPFTKVPDDVLERQRKRAENWRALCEKYALTPAA